MNVKGLLTAVAVFAAGILCFAGSASAQFGGQVAVSNVIEGGVGGVSMARCGSNVVVGFADAESTNPYSFDGFATSTNGGLSFTDRGTLPTPPFDPSLGPAILGSNSTSPFGPSNPAVTCVNSSRFYYGSIYHPSGDKCNNSGGGCTAISVSTSTNGGASWGLPVVTTIQGEDIFEFVSPSMAVDPTNLMHLYVAFISFDNTSFFSPCDDQAYELAIVQSTDGGKTWGDPLQPLRVDHACNGANSEVQGTLATPDIIVSPGGKVYVAYEFVPLVFTGQTPRPNEIRFTRSLDHGTTFSAPIIVSTHATKNALPRLAVDRTTLSSRGEIYLTWSGSPSGTYTDVLVSDSLNFGQSFSFPRPVSATPPAGVGRFETTPVIAVDNDGQVADCYYSTPTNTPTSSSVYGYDCRESFNRGASWTAQRLVNSAPVGFDAVTSDFLLHNDGFFTAFEVQASGIRHVVGAKADNP